MDIKTKVKVGDQMVEGVEIDIKSSEEAWSTYTLSDGTVIKVKPVVTKVIRTDKFLPDRNDPIYAISSRTVVDAIVPEALKKKHE